VKPKTPVGRKGRSAAQKESENTRTSFENSLTPSHVKIESGGSK